MEQSLSATADRSLFVFDVGSFDHPNEIFGVRPGDEAASGSGRRIRRPHPALPLERRRPARPGASPSHSTGRATPFNVQGWLMFPKDYDPSKKYPLIVEVHGGPASAVLSRWGAALAASALRPSPPSATLCSMPNPRGSYGQGEAFTQANRKDFGYGDLRDILAGVDTVLAQIPRRSQPRRTYAGWSYGGFMTMFAVTQTNRFKAAVAGAGISDWLSYYGENSIDQWMIPYFGASVYDDPAGLRQKLGHQLHQAGPDAHPDRGRRPRRRVSGAPVLRVLACPPRSPRSRATGRLPQRRPRLRRSRPSPRRAGARRRLVRPLHAPCSRNPELAPRPALNPRAVQSMGVEKQTKTVTGPLQARGGSS